MDDLDALVTQLHTAALGPATNAAIAERLNSWLGEVVVRSASDLILVAGAPPVVRIEGKLVALATGLLDGTDIQQALEPVLPAHASRAFAKGSSVDASYRIPSLGRFRINLHRERGRPAATIRRLPSGIPRLASLNLPPSVELLSRLRRGLVAIGGPAGSGKTTTLAALVNEINHREARHIITIEDPIEYEHVNVKSIVEQIEIGIDAPDFATALRAAVRQAPDVIVVGEMRDPETMHIALSAGETGHLVFSSLHTSDVANTVSRISDSFPPERQNTIRQELAMAITAVLTQSLVPRISGGVVPAAELLMVSYGARQHIRKNALHHLHQEITITRKNGSFTLEQSLADLVQKGAIDVNDALARTAHPDDLETLLVTHGPGQHLG